MTRFPALVPMIISKSRKVRDMCCQTLFYNCLRLIPSHRTHFAFCFIPILNHSPPIWLLSFSVFLDRAILPPSRLGMDRVITGPQFVGTVSPFHALIAQLMHLGVHSCVNLPLDGPHCDWISDAIRFRNLFLLLSLGLDRWWSISSPIDAFPF